MRGTLSNQKRSPAAADPFDLADKNPRRVAPAVRRSIRIQTFRMVGAVATLLFVGSMMAAGWFGWIPEVIGIGAMLISLVIVPASLLGLFCDWGIRRRHEARLRECERLIGQEGR